MDHPSFPRIEIAIPGKGWGGVCLWGFLSIDNPIRVEL